MHCYKSIYMLLYDSNKMPINVQFVYHVSDTFTQLIQTFPPFILLYWSYSLKVNFCFI